jgi:hypothetical protein
MVTARSSGSYVAATRLVEWPRMTMAHSVIGRVQAVGSSWEDAKNQVVAVVEGISVSELTSDLVRVKPVQERTQAILTWLSNHADANGGRLVFDNTDLARAAGWPRPNQALGNLVSRLDLCCAKVGLPAIGCAAANTFKDAWQRPGENRVQHHWSFPVELMQRRAKPHHWTRDDFDRINQESRALLIGSAYLAWDEYMAKHEARVKDWAYR